MGEVIIFGNFKGGIGKIINVMFVCLVLVCVGKKMLLIDFDF